VYNERRRHRVDKRAGQLPRVAEPTLMKYGSSGRSGPDHSAFSTGRGAVGVDRFQKARTTRAGLRFRRHNARVVELRIAPTKRVVTIAKRTIRRGDCRKANVVT